MKFRLLFFLCLFAMISCHRQGEHHSNDKNIHSDEEANHEHNGQVEMKNNESTLAHTVFFWLTEESTEADKKNFEEGLRKLSTVESIDKFFWGPPAATPKRDVIDNSYDYAINAFFKDLASQDAYQKDPVHLEFIEKYKQLWARVQVYDNQINRH